MHSEAKAIGKPPELWKREPRRIPSDLDLKTNDDENFLVDDNLKIERQPVKTIDLMNHKAKLCAHGGMKKWVVKYWETYAPVVN